VTHGIGADGTNVRIGNIEASLAVFDLLPHFDDGFSKADYFLRFGFEQVQYQPQGRFPANAGQFGKFIHRIFQ
jgi:hypothetical protein